MEKETEPLTGLSQMDPESIAKIQQLIFSIAKITLGFSIIGAIIWYTPALELMYGFAYMFLIPLALLAATGMISKESLAFFQLSAKELRQRIYAARNEIRAQST